MTTTNSKPKRSVSSFRDPAGHIFERNGVIFRNVGTQHKSHYDALLGSGLFDRLRRDDLVLDHETADASHRYSEDAYLTLRPERLPFVSYPFEWTFGQVREAALLTLKIQRMALEHGLVLKDAPAQNIQFRRGRAVHIDILSFERYSEGQPWVAYRQFCRHFLAPLAVMAYCDERLGRLLAKYPDGLPLDLAVSLLPLRARMRPSLWFHLVLHASAERKTFAGKKHPPLLPKGRLLMLVQNLENSIRRLRPPDRATLWSGYEERTPYTSAGLQSKKNAVAALLAELNPRVVWDIGANVGVYSRIAAKSAELVLAADSDERAADQLYQGLRAEENESIHPLVLDFATWPGGMAGGSPVRPPYARANADVVVGLALIHHLRLTHGIPFRRMAEMFRPWGRFLLLEYIPKDDEQVREMLQNRVDVFDDYSWTAFLREFRAHYEVRKTLPIQGSQRVLVIFERRRGGP